MTRYPTVAIVGRPNVGKSALFNRLCKQRISIVDEAEGVTRDRLYAKADYFGHPFELIDTGGIDPGSDIPYNELIRRQAEIAIEEADRLIFVVDGQVGPTDVDLQVAQILHRQQKPVVLAVNKVDAIDQVGRIYPFQRLGFSQIVGVSASHGLQVAELLESTFQTWDWNEEEAEEESPLKVAIIGRPNVGKSTLVNYLLDDERVLVSPIPGTTRDSVDIDIEVHGKAFRLIDTAGIRRKRAEHEAVDKFAAIRTERAMERADLCVLMLNAQEGMTTQEKRIASELEELGKGCLLVFNKWDLVQGFRMEHCIEAIQQEVPFLAHCPSVFISAKTGRNVEKIFPYVQKVYDHAAHRVPTGELNRFLEKALQTYHPPMLGGKRLRIYYVAQVGVLPPKFVFFVNRPELMVDSYKKYLVNAFRKSFPFAGVPLQFSCRGKIDRHDVDE